MFPSGPLHGRLIRPSAFVLLDGRCYWSLFGRRATLNDGLGYYRLHSRDNLHSRILLSCHRATTKG
eukprot:1183590-Prorocentrum_minimum.AAC.3